MITIIDMVEGHDFLSVTRIPITWLDPVQFLFFWHDAVNNDTFLYLYQKEKHCHTGLDLEPLVFFLVFFFGQQPSWLFVNNEC